MGSFAEYEMEGVGKSWKRNGKDDREREGGRGSEIGEEKA
jgi:hypothetical protein